jgi:pilus assembly protein CpaB
MKKIRIVALISAIITFMCAYILMQPPGESSVDGNTTGQDNVSVVVAKQDIPPYTTLTADVLSIQPMTVATDSGYFTSLDEVIGLVTVSDIFAGEIITSKRVVESDDFSLGMSAKIEPGKRAITIMVDAEQGVGYHLEVGNYVDVIYRAEADMGEVNGSTVPAGVAFTNLYGVQNPKNSSIIQENLGEFFSVIAVQNVKILAVENLLYSSGDISEPEYSHVTLEVTPAQAEDIALMNDAAGWIQLILRAQGDHDILSEDRHSVLGN